MSKTVTAEQVGWIFVCKVEGVTPVLSDTPDWTHLSPETWTREPVYRLSALPTVTVERIPLATSRPLDTSRREVEA